MDNKRFGFGTNWSNYIKELNEKQIIEAEKSINNFLPSEDFKNKSFLDIGCGSGLFSLVAKRFGAQVFSMDYDENSVKCAQELRHRYYPESEDWVIEQGDVLNDKYMSKLINTGYDIVYSWGVLHHTGNMYKAIKNASKCVKPGGIFFISIYNDQGKKSIMWKKIKKFYNSSPQIVKYFIALSFTLIFWGPILFRDILDGKPFYSWKSYYLQRGMSPWIDVVDWVGGYPFEVATPQKIRSYCNKLGLTLVKVHACGGGGGCNQYVFKSAE